MPQLATLVGRAMVRGVAITRVFFIVIAESSEDRGSVMP
jgi:hypothetical protein